MCENLNSNKKKFWRNGMQNESGAAVLVNSKLQSIYFGTVGLGSSKLSAAPQPYRDARNNTWMKMKTKTISTLSRKLYISTFCFVVFVHFLSRKQLWIIAKNDCLWAMCSWLKLFLKWQMKNVTWFFERLHVFALVLLVLYIFWHAYRIESEKKETIIVCVWLLFCLNFVHKKKEMRNVFVCLAK